jgi:hypothetical protein
VWHPLGIVIRCTPVTVPARVLCRDRLWGVSRDRGRGRGSGTKLWVRVRVRVRVRV